MTATRRALPPHPDRRHQRTRSAIIDAGQKLFAARAMEGVTIDDIVAEAAVAKGSFYNHFEHKQGLADAILDLVHNDCEYHILAANGGVTDPPARIARALCVMVAYAARHPDRLRALMSLSERRRAAGSPLNTGVASDVADGIAAGRFVGINLETGMVIANSLIPAAVLNLAATPGAIAAAMLRALGVADPEATAIAAAAVADLLEEPK